MIIDKLILHDFGVYGGYQEINLTPVSPEAPVVLFGGLNGAGKTTLLDALQLCLFGKAAQCWSKDGLSYNEYLASCINKHARNKEAMIAMSFRHTANGKEMSYLIRRSWRKTAKGVVPNFTVDIGGSTVSSFSNNWLQHIEEIMPANIAPLFFFDGEQAEAYVTADKASELIETAILNLLGLDIVHQLRKDLKTLERRNAVKELDDGKKVDVSQMEQAINDINATIERFHQKSAWLRTYELIPGEKRLEELDEMFRKAGGHLYDRRAEIETSANQLQNELSECEEAVRKMAEGCLPFALMGELLSNLVSRDKRERKALDAQVTLKSIEKVNWGLMRHLQASKADNESQRLVESYLTDEINRIKKSVAGTIENPLDEHARLSLLALSSDRLVNAQVEAEKLLSLHSELKQQAEDAKLEWSSVPKESDVESILTERKSVQQGLDRSVKELEEIAGKIKEEERQRKKREDELQSLISEEAERQIKDEDNRRLLTFSAMARDTLGVFSREVIKKHIDHIQALVLENYQSLLRKKSLIANVLIDPETFKVQLRDQAGRLVPTVKLSAGERQLLAISLLWGMAKASGRPLPAAIDTPLGRLDATHRKYLVERYFPYASHQVLLFSTDQEVSGKYYEDLRDRVGRSYRLEYDDKTSTTTVREGYLQ